MHGKRLEIVKRCDPTFLSYTCLSLCVFEVLSWDVPRFKIAIQLPNKVTRSNLQVSGVSHASRSLIMVLKNQPAKQWRDQSIWALSLNTFTASGLLHHTHHFNMRVRRNRLSPALQAGATSPCLKIFFLINCSKRTPEQRLREVRDRWRGREVVGVTSQ